MIIAVKITSNIKNFRISSINNTRALNGGEEKEYKRGQPLPNTELSKAINFMQLIKIKKNSLPQHQFNF